MTTVDLQLYSQKHWACGRKFSSISAACTSCSVDLVVTHPCMRSPCGPYSHCRNVDGHAVCSCLTGYYGQPPNCHPECTSNSECPLDKSCVNQKCVNPCVGVCGYNALCHCVKIGIQWKLYKYFQIFLGPRYHWLFISESRDIFNAEFKSVGRFSPTLLNLW